jgi:putative ABC transport system substrate-binding protein
MDRRGFISTLAAGLAAVPITVGSADDRRVHIGVLGVGAGPPPHQFSAFRERLMDFGYVDGQNVAMDQRYADGRLERIPDLLAELIALHPAAIVVVRPYVLKVAHAATTNTPLIAIDFESDPVAAGFVTSLARPGGYVTGTLLDQADLSGKWLQLLKENNPRVTRVAVGWDFSTPPYQLDAIKLGARSIAVELQTLTIRTRDDLRGVFGSAAKAHAQAVVILSSPLVSTSGALLANLSVARHLPTISMFRENVTAGCLMSYGPSLVEDWRRLGSFTGRVLKGAKPADLPIERPTTFELVLNLKTAKALGLTIPPALLGRADEVIQ